ICRDSRVIHLKLGVTKREEAVLIFRQTRIINDHPDRADRSRGSDSAASILSDDSVPYEEVASVSGQVNIDLVTGRGIIANAGDYAFFHMQRLFGSGVY